jgi:hypothetical protein
MAVESTVRLKSLIATASLASSQYCFVRLDFSGGIVLPAAGGDAIGVLQDKPAAGDPGAVCGPGDITKVKAGGSFSAGAYLQATAAGKAVSTTTGAASLGQALQASTGDGQIVSMIFQPSAV